MAASVLLLPYPLMALLRGVVTAHYPATAATWQHKGSFAVLGMLGTESDDEPTYAARVQAASRHLLPRDPFYKESRSRRLVLMDMATYALMGLVQRVTGDINVTWLFFRWACGFAWFLLVYQIAFKLAGDVEWALFAAAFVTFFSYVLTLLFLSGVEPSSLLNPASWPKLVWRAASFGRTDGVLRVPRPGITYAALFGAGLLNVLAVERRTRFWVLASGLVGGAMIYFRLDVGSSYLAAAGLFAAAAWWKDAPALRPAAASFALSAALSLPWFLVQFPLDPDIALRVNPTMGRSPDWWSLPYLAVFLWVVFRPGRHRMLLWCGCLVGAVFAACNVQVLMGYCVEPFHWKFIGNVFVFFAALGLAAERLGPLAGRWRALPRPGAAAALILTVMCAAQGVVYAGIHYPYQALPADDEAALRWVAASTPPDAVVAVGGFELNVLVPAYTGRYTLVAFASPLISDIPLEENFNRLSALLALLGTDAEAYLAKVMPAAAAARGVDFRRVFDHRLHDLSYWSFGTALWVPPEKAAGLLRSAAARGAAPACPADYLWVGPTERYLAGPAFPKGARWPLAEVYSNPTVTLYKIACP